MKREMTKSPVKEPSNETTRGKNGLVYVEFAIRNNTQKTIHTVVKGPQKFPFSYGVPFPSGKRRIEKWPVGTRLFKSDNESPKYELFAVRASDAGSTIDLSEKLKNL